MEPNGGNGNGRNGWLKAAGVVLGVAVTSIGTNLGQSYYLRESREPPPLLGAESGALAAQVQQNKQAIAALQIELKALQDLIDRLSLERERRFQALEARVDALQRRP